MVDEDGVLRRMLTGATLSPEISGERLYSLIISLKESARSVIKRFSDRKILKYITLTETGRITI